MAKTQVRDTPSKKNTATQQTNHQRPSVPLWKSPYFWLIIIPLALYLRILWFDFTALDDQFFVVDRADYNADAGNIMKTLNSGLFLPENDSYYRPVFLIDMILEGHLFGTKPWGFHLFSLLFHLASVLLLFQFLKKLQISEINAGFLSLLFSVHPVLSQTVAWIPGRNDQILMIFTLSSLIFLIRHIQSGRFSPFVFHFLTFFLALLTKETAVMIPVLSLVIILFVFPGNSRRLPLLSGFWIVGIIFWYVLRQSSHPSYEDLFFQQMIRSGIARIPAFLQYLGKFFFPFNLSVVPQFEEISLIWGLIAFTIMVVISVYFKIYKKPLFLFGLIWYFLFLIPVLIVPKVLNDQVYEHRLYLPVVGILLIMSELIALRFKFPEKYLTYGFAGIVVFYALVSGFRMSCYQDRTSFWKSATEDSPKSAFAWLNRGIQSKDTLLRETFVRKAYEINSQEMLVNYWMGIMMERKKNQDSAAWFYRREFAFSNFPDLYINFSRVLFGQKKFDSAAYYLNEALKLDPTKQKAVKVLTGIYFRLAENAWQRDRFDSSAYYLFQVTRFDPLNQEANHNLAMVLFRQNRRSEALQVMENMRMNGLTITPDLVAMSK